MGRPAAPRIGRLQVALVRGGKKKKKKNMNKPRLNLRSLNLDDVPYIAGSYLMPVGVLISLAKMSSTMLLLAFLGVSSTTTTSSTTC